MRGVELESHTALRLHPHYQHTLTTLSQHIPIYTRLPFLGRPSPPGTRYQPTLITHNTPLIALAFLDRPSPLLHTITPASFIIFHHPCLSLALRFLTGPPPRYVLRMFCSSFSLSLGSLNAWAS